MPFNIPLTLLIGRLSGCTFEEAVSWGKVKKEASKVQVFSDATITVPLVVQALQASGHRRKELSGLQLARGRSRAELQVKKDFQRPVAEASCRL